MLSDGPSVEAVYQQLYAEHAGLVLKYLSDKLDHATAEDVAQDAWLRAHRFLPDVLGRGDTAGKAWVLRIATNAMYDHFRRVKARPRTRDLDDVVAPGAVFPEALQDRTTPETIALDAVPSERAGLVALLVEGLPHNERVVLWLCEYGRLSLDDTGATLGLTHAAVKTRLFRARRLLGDLVRAAEAALPNERPQARLWSFVHRRGPGECWPWYGARIRQTGTPEFSVLNELTGGAARLLWALQKGPLAPWAIVRSGCGDLGCVNPAHLWATVRSERAGPRVDPRWLTGPLPGAVPSGAALQAARRRLSLSQDEAGALAGLSNVTVQLMEQSGRTAPGRRPRAKDGDDAPVEQRVVARLLVAAALHAVRAPRPALTGEALRARRVAVGLTQSALAHACDMAPRALAAVERRHGRCGVIATRQRIAAVLETLERDLTPVEALPDGATVRARRLALGLTQPELGAAMGYGPHFSVQVVGRVERDRGTLRMLPIRRRLIEALDRLEHEQQEAAA